MKKIAFISPPDASPGFGLAGVSRHVADTESAEPVFCAVKDEREVGLIVIDERLLKDLTEERLAELEQGWHGLHLIMPSPTTPPPEVEDYAARMIRRAIGYHVRLKL